MKNLTTRSLLVTLFTMPCIVLPTVVLADWSGGIEGGAVIQGDDKGSKIRFKMSNSERPLNQQFYADWIRPDNGGDSYKFGYEPQYWFSDKTYVFGDASYLTAKDSAIDQETNLFAGVGLQLLNSATQTLFAEVGAGQTTTEFSAPGVMKQETDSTIARVGASQVLTDFFKLELDGDYSTSDLVDRTTAEAGLSFRVPGGAIKYTYRARNTEFSGQPSVETTDSSVSFNYNF